MVTGERGRLLVGVVAGRVEEMVGEMKEPEPPVEEGEGEGEGVEVALVSLLALSRSLLY